MVWHVDVCMVSVTCFFFKQKTAYEMRISDWSSDVCSSDLPLHVLHAAGGLDRDAAVVEGHALADQRERGITRPGHAPLERQQPRLAARSLFDAKQLAPADIPHLVLPAHRYVAPDAFYRLAYPPRHAFWSKDCARLLCTFAGLPHSPRLHL